MSTTILSKLRSLRVGRPQQPAEAPPVPSFDGPALRSAINRDSSLSKAEQSELHGWLDNPETIKGLQSGGIGAALSYMVAKFLKLKPQTQLLLSIAGFGIGKIIYDYKTNPKKFSSYNEQLRMYEIHN
jgi:hypothetical protein